jgi:hypothetical protein
MAHFELKLSAQKMFSWGYLKIYIYAVAPERSITINLSLCGSLSFQSAHFAHMANCARNAKCAPALSGGEGDGCAMLIVQLC